MSKSKQKSGKLKARGVRFSDDQWSHLSKKAGKHSTPSDYNRQLVDADIKREKTNG